MSTTVRRRPASEVGVGTRREGPVRSQSTKFSRTLRAVDVFARVDEDLQVKTETGAAVTLGFWVLMIFLVIGELQAHLRERPPTERVVVDPTMGQRLRIDADILGAIDIPGLAFAEGCLMMAKEPLSVNAATTRCIQQYWGYGNEDVAGGSGTAGPVARLDCAERAGRDAACSGNLPCPKRLKSAFPATSTCGRRHAPFIGGIEVKTFHAIPCLDVHVDAMDVAGENQIDIDHDMSKQRLDPDGRTIGDPFAEVPGEGDQGLELPSDYCGSCFGARQGCCNTCEELVDAYHTMGWTAHDIRRSAEQCIRDNHMETPIMDGEGCRLSGFMTVNKRDIGCNETECIHPSEWTSLPDFRNDRAGKVSGNFHVAAGEGVMQDGRHIHIYDFADAVTFNTSHTIHHLSFGQPYVGMRANPLDGITKIIDEEVGTGLFQYFIKLVPTIHLVGAKVDGTAGKEPAEEAIRAEQVTSQFAYTYKFRSMKGSTEYHSKRVSADNVPAHHATHGEEGHPNTADTAAKANTMLLPGVFIMYDVSPFMVEVIPPSKSPFSHLVIRLCAVAGGALGLSSIVDSAVFYASNRLRRQDLLG